MKQWLCLLLLFALTESVMSGTANNLYVEHVRVDRNGKGYVAFTQAITNRAACATYTQHFSFDATTPGGSAVLSLTLAAKAAGKRIYASGTNTCLEYPNVVESWNWGYILD